MLSHLMLQRRGGKLVEVSPLQVALDLFTVFLVLTCVHSQRQQGLSKTCAQTNASVGGVPLPKACMNRCVAASYVRMRGQWIAKMLNNKRLLHAGTSLHGSATSVMSTADAGETVDEYTPKHRQHCYSAASKRPRT